MGIYPNFSLLKIHVIEYGYGTVGQNIQCINVCRVRLLELLEKVSSAISIVESS